MYRIGHVIILKHVFVSPLMNRFNENKLSLFIVVTRKSSFDVTTLCTILCTTHHYPSTNHNSPHGRIMDKIMILGMTPELLKCTCAKRCGPRFFGHHHNHYSNFGVGNVSVPQQFKKFENHFYKIIEILFLRFN